jgi:hypothetical protein
LLLASDVRRNGKSKPRIVTLARGSVTIRKHGRQNVTLRLTPAGRRFVAAHGVRVAVTAVIDMTVNGRTRVIKTPLTLKIKKPSTHRKH